MLACANSQLPMACTSLWEGGGKPPELVHGWAAMRPKKEGEECQLEEPKRNVCVCVLQNWQMFYSICSVCVAHSHYNCMSAIHSIYVYI